jgi:hypothetical protein
MSLRVAMRIATPVLLVCLIELTWIASPHPDDLLAPVTIACLALGGYFSLRGVCFLARDVGLVDAMFWPWRQGRFTLDGMPEDAAREHRMARWFMLGAFVLMLLEVARMFRKH